MYKYKYQMYTGIFQNEFSHLHKELIIESNTKLSKEEVHKKALELMSHYPRSYHYKVEVIEETNPNKELLDDIERLMMSISVRKTEISDKHFNENLGKPDFTDLDWCFEQLYYLKKEHR